MFFGNELPPFLPFLTMEQLWTNFNEAGQHFEDGYLSPLLTLSRAESDD